MPVDAVATEAATAFASMAELRNANAALLDEFTDLDVDALPDKFLASIDRFRHAAAATGAGLAVTEARAEAQSAINFWTTLLFSGGRRPDSVLLGKFDRDVARQRAGDQAPYKGLEPFQIDDIGKFFGRQRAIEETIRMLATHRFLAVVGPSGSGKSSVVRAGLIPRLRSGEVPDADKWRVLDPIVPGRSPRDALASLVQQIDPALPAPEDAQAFAAALDSAGVPVVACVDQFEEIFTLAPSEEQRKAFIDALVTGATETRFPHVIVITIRSEFDSLINRYETLHALFIAGRVQLEALSPQDLRAAIEQPAALFGARLEPGLADELVQSVLGEPAGLPLLQFALLELWRQRTPDDELTRSAYLELGGSPREILARKADEVLASFALQEQRTLSRRIFLALVGSGLEPTGRRLTRSELDTLAARDSIDSVLGVWRRNGLIRIAPPGPITGESSIEVAHEALIRNWRQFEKWIEDNIALTRSRRVLNEQATAWASGAQDTLLGELSLDEWEKQHAELDEIEQRYVVASREQVERKKHELATRDLALKRRTQVAMAVALMGTALLVFGTIQGIQAADQGRQAAEQSNLTKEALRDLEKTKEAARTAIKDEQRKAAEQEEALRERIIALNGNLRKLQGARQSMQAELAVAIRERHSATLMRDGIITETAGAVVRLGELSRKIEAFEKQVEDLKDTIQGQDVSIKDLAAQARPVLPLDGGRLGSIPETARGLEARRSTVERIARSVGRIQGPQYQNQAYVSTAFLIGDGVAVVPSFALHRGFEDLEGLTIDFRSAPDGDTRHGFAVQEVIGELGPADNRSQRLVLLRIARRNRLGEDLPPPLGVAEVNRDTKLSSRGGHGLISPFKGMDIFVVGYPSYDSRISDEANKLLLGDKTGDERVQPGALLDFEVFADRSVLRYDATTFGGNSGSPVVDLASGLVIGIHVGGSVFGTEQKGINSSKYGIAIDSVLTHSAQWRLAGLNTERAPRTVD